MLQEIEVFRYDPASGEEPRFERYQMETFENSTVLDALFTIVEETGEPISFRCSCRLGMCGSCAMLINGRERLACRTKIQKLSNPVRVQPLRNLPVIRDLVVDMTPFFEKWKEIKPYFIGDASADPDEFARIPAGSPSRGMIDESLDCITCGACWSACTVVALDDQYLGPAALNRAYTLIQDERDVAADERLAIVSGEHGIERCHTLFNCMEVCPKHLKPTWTIQKLKVKSIQTKREMKDARV